MILQVIEVNQCKENACKPYLLYNKLTFTKVNIYILFFWDLRLFFFKLYKKLTLLLNFRVKSKSLSN